ncbi:LysE family translocator, partial [Pseudomonas viridiflava]|uniref:LysE family translocator n=1 Tax=Pseudomonas viridiflava TaxID=33069 RepID=UPI003C7ACF3F
VNPKTWMMALAVVSVFSQGTVAHLALAFFLVSLPCLACWALLGAGSARLLKSARALQWLNRSMAVLLLVSAWAAYLNRPGRHQQQHRHAPVKPLQGTG